MIRARRMLATGERGAQADVTLGPDSGQCCGGRVEVNLSPVNDAPVANDDPLQYGIEDVPLRIRIENLLVVQDATPLPGSDPERSFLDWRTLTFVPIDRRLIVPALLDPAARTWLNAYHAEVAEKIGPRVSPVTKLWLDAATAPI